MIKNVVLNFFLVLLIISAGVQYNDPDALLWIVIYLFPAFMIFYRNRLSQSNFILVGFVYLLWSINLFPAEWEGLGLENMSMKTMNIELARESLGLAMVCLMLWVTYLFRRE